ncbi:MAG: hypothetical protein EBT07_04040 [Actinobacteria bacterium]|nr:hypothetical protein [Actinomycetota bacterium]
MSVRLGKQSFPLSNSLDDRVRRDLYFKNGTGSLLPEEQKILDAIGIDKRLEGTLKPYLSEFFEKLPECQTDTSLVLSKNCEIPHFVVWSALFDSHARSQEAVVKNRKLFQKQMDITDAMDVALVSGMKERIDPDADYKTLFMLMLDKKPITVSKTIPATEYNAIFTLML